MAASSDLFGALRRWLRPAPPPPPAPTGVFARCRWLRGDESPFGVDVLDMAPAVSALQSSGASPEQTARALGWTLDDGHQHAVLASPAPAVALAPGDLAWPAPPVLPDGALFRPQALEDKWALFLQKGRLLLIQSWSGTLACAVDVVPRDGALVATAIHGDPTGGRCGDTAELVRVVDFLVQSHALGRILPAPLLAGLPAADVEQLTLWSFRCFGRRALALSAAPPPAPAPVPLRTDTAVHIAALAGRADLVMGAAKAGLALDLPGTFQGYGPLHIAAAMGHEEVAMVLLSQGISVDQPTAPSAADGGGETPLQVCCRQHKAGQDPVARLLLSAGADPRVCDADGATPLHLAARAGQLEVCTALLVAGCPADAVDHRGHSALHVAAELGHAVLVERLRAAGASATQRSRAGQLPADLARAQGHDALARQLAPEA